MMDNNLLDTASHCPVCEVRPVESREDVLGNERVFLRCPNGHPYVICGDTSTAAILHWNEYVSYHLHHDTTQMFGTIKKNNKQSFCRHCRRFTPSTTYFDKVHAKGTHLDYSLVRQQCVDCHLTKFQTEAA